jgi:hypothetical protein
VPQRAVCGIGRVGQEGVGVDGVRGSQIRTNSGFDHKERRATKEVTLRIIETRGMEWNFTINATYENDSSERYCPSMPFLFVPDCSKMSQLMLELP